MTGRGEDKYPGKVSKIEPPKLQRTDAESELVHQHKRTELPTEHTDTKFIPLHRENKVFTEDRIEHPSTKSFYELSFHESVGESNTDQDVNVQTCDTATKVWGGGSETPDHAQDVGQKITRDGLENIMDGAAKASTCALLEQKTIDNAETVKASADETSFTSQDLRERVYNAPEEIKDYIARQPESHLQQSTSHTEGANEKQRLTGYHEHKKVFIDNRNQNQSTKLLKTVLSGSAEFFGDINGNQDVNDKIYDATEEISNTAAVTSDHFPQADQKTVNIPENISSGRLALDIQDVGQRKTVDIICIGEITNCVQYTIYIYIQYITDGILVSVEVPECAKDCPVGALGYFPVVKGNIAKNISRSPKQKTLDMLENVEHGVIQTPGHAQDATQNTADNPEKVTARNFASVASVTAQEAGEKVNDVLVRDAVETKAGGDDVEVKGPPKRKGIANVVDNTIGAIKSAQNVRQKTINDPKNTTSYDAHQCAVFSFVKAQKKLGIFERLGNSEPSRRNLVHQSSYERQFEFHSLYFYTPIVHEVNLRMQCKLTAEISRKLNRLTYFFYHLTDDTAPSYALRRKKLKWLNPEKDKRLCFLSKYEISPTSNQHSRDENFKGFARGKNLRKANEASTSICSDTSDQKTTFELADCHSDKPCLKGVGLIPVCQHISDQKTIVEPVGYFSEKARPKGLGSIPIPEDELQNHIEERLSRESSFQGSGRVHLYPPVENLIAAGLRRIGNNLVCDGCHRSHPIALYNTMDLSPSSLHDPLCRYIDRVLCRHCCQGMDSIGQGDEEGCIRCGRAIRLRAFGENTMQFPNANLQREQDLRAFSEEICCVEGCNRTVQQGLERCLRCNGRVCDDCTGRCCGSNRTFN